jgi:hypothetical protein
MLIVSLAALLLLASPQQQDAQSPETDASPPLRQVLPSTGHPELTSNPEIQKKLAEDRAMLDKRCREARRINELAANIHSEKDARAFIDAVAEEVSQERQMLWAEQGIRQRVAKAEYASVSDSEQRISDQRIADVWNEFVRELDAPEKTLVTATDIHQQRATRYQMNETLWSRGYPGSIWNMPNIHAVGEEGQLADGARALEAIATLYSMGSNFSTVLVNRQRLQKQAPTSPPGLKPPTSRSAFVVQGKAWQLEDPIRAAINRYVDAHGQEAYDQLLKRLLNELFPQ